MVTRKWAIGKKTASVSFSADGAVFCVLGEGIRAIIKGI